MQQQGYRLEIIYKNQTLVTFFSCPGLIAYEVAIIFRTKCMHIKGIHCRNGQIEKTEMDIEQILSGRYGKLQ